MSGEIYGIAKQFRTMLGKNAMHFFRRKEKRMAICLWQIA